MALGTFAASLLKLRQRAYSLGDEKDVNEVRKVISQFLTQDGKGFVIELVDEHDVMLEFILNPKWSPVDERIKGLQKAYLSHLQTLKTQLPKNEWEMYNSPEYRLLEECKRILKIHNPDHDPLSDLPQRKYKELENPRGLLVNAPKLNRLTLAKMADSEVIGTLESSASTNGRIFYNMIKLSVSDPSVLIISS